MPKEKLKTSPPEMYSRLFNAFAVSSDTLQAYQDGELVFSSDKERLLALIEYIGRAAPHQQPVVIFDKITGNAAALLSVKAGCREVYSPLGSQLAIKTLNKYGINYHFTKTIAYIQKPDMADMCPMERLSIDKEPEDFYSLVKTIIK